MSVVQASAHLLSAIVLGIPRTLLFHSLPQWHVNSIIYGHAIRTPLTSLQFALSVLNEKSTVRQRRQAIKLAQAALGEVTDLVSQRSISTVRKFDVASEIEASIRTLHTVKARGQIVFQKCCRESLHLVGEHVLFQHLLAILIHNAELAYPPDVIPYIVVSLHQSNTYIKVVVHDFGQGMSFFEKYLSRLVGESRTHTGMGIGLACAAMIITRNFHGNFELQSTKHLGTKAICRFPRRPG